MTKAVRLCATLLVAGAVFVPVSRAAPAASAAEIDDTNYTAVCRDLAALAYWATLDEWTAIKGELRPRQKAAIRRRDRPVRARFEQARRQALVPNRARPGIPLRYARRAEDFGRASFGKDLHWMPAEDAQANAVIAATDMHGKCYGNHGQGIF